MSFACWQHWLLLFAFVLATWAATHDEMGRCGLTGVYKMRQSVLESPNYPDNYPIGTCWDYVVRSPYRCPTKFHIQFLDFFLESSSNCTNDYLAVGLENDGDDMDLLCGQVIGIKKYHTPDGVLRLRFRSDDSPWTTGKGFKLLVTRLACEREDLTRVNFREVDDDSERVDAPPLNFQPPYNNRSMLFRNFSYRDQYDTQSRDLGPPLQYGWNIPGTLPGPPLPPAVSGFYLPFPQQQVPTRRPAIQVQLLDDSTATDKPCAEKSMPTAAPLSSYYNSFNNQQLPNFNDQYINNPWIQQQQLPPVLRAQQVDNPLGANTPEPCCASSFRQQHFYLSSPGFPRTAFTSLLPVSQRNCQFLVEKTLPSVCRLRIEFKFYYFGQTFDGNGDSQGNVNIAIGTSRDVCTEDYVEIDGERFCGCRTGYVFTAPWGLGQKVLRMRMGYSGIASNGFLLDIVQEECSEEQQQQQPGQIIAGIQSVVAQKQPNQSSAAAPFGIQQLNLQNRWSQFSSQQPQQQLQTLFGQQQLQPGFQQQSFYVPQPNYQQQFTGFTQNPQQQPLLYPQQPWNLPQIPYIPPNNNNRFGYREYRRAKRLHVQPVTAASSHQPITVVETNSTRKEYYYFDGDEDFTRSRQPIAEAERSTDNDNTDHKEENIDDLEINRVNSKIFSRERNRCRFEASDVLRLTVDALWITKPTCYAPQRSWFGNIFG